MDALGTHRVALPTLPTHGQAAIPALPKATGTPGLPAPKPSGGDDLSAKLAEQKRFEALQKMAQNTANVYVVSDRTFSLFKDATGQYITRFTSLRDGKITYIPEPEMFKQSHTSAEAAVVSIKV